MRPIWLETKKWTLCEKDLFSQFYCGGVSQRLANYAILGLCPTIVGLKFPDLAADWNSWYFWYPAVLRTFGLGLKFQRLVAATLKLSEGVRKHVILISRFRKLVLSFVRYMIQAYCPAPELRCHLCEQYADECSVRLSHTWTKMSRMNNHAHIRSSQKVDFLLDLATNSFEPKVLKSWKWLFSEYFQRGSKPIFLQKGTFWLQLYYPSLKVGNFGQRPKSLKVWAWRQCAFAFAAIKLA